MGSNALSTIWSQLFVKRINNNALSGKSNKKKIYVLKKIIEIIGEFENELLIFSTVLNRLILWEGFWEIDWNRSLAIYSDSISIVVSSAQT